MRVGQSARNSNPGEVIVHAAVPSGPGALPVNQPNTPPGLASISSALGACSAAQACVFGQDGHPSMRSIRCPSCLLALSLLGLSVQGPRAERAELLTKTEAARLLKLDDGRHIADAVRSLERLIRRGDIVATRIGRHSRIWRLELLRFIHKRTYGELESS